MHPSFLAAIVAALLFALVVGALGYLVARRWVSALVAARIGVFLGLVLFPLTCAGLNAPLERAFTSQGTGLTLAEARAAGIDIELPADASNIDYYRVLGSVEEVDFTSEITSVKAWASARGWMLESRREDAPYIDPVKKFRIEGRTKYRIVPRECLVYNERAKETDSGILVAYDRAEQRVYYRWRR